MTGGIESTDLVFIAARPSMGKTELALDIIDKVSAQGHGVLFFQYGDVGHADHQAHGFRCRRDVDVSPESRG